jgi:hypothetical protein
MPGSRDGGRDARPRLCRSAISRRPSGVPRSVDDTTPRSQDGAPPTRDTGVRASLHPEMASPPLSRRNPLNIGSDASVSRWTVAVSRREYRDLAPSRDGDRSSRETATPRANAAAGISRRSATTLGGNLPEMGKSGGVPGSLRAISRLQGCNLTPVLRPRRCLETPQARDAWVRLGS